MSDTKLKVDFTSVKITMDLLIHANGKTTTKEVKEHLRGLNFIATQSEISTMMDDLFSNSDGYLRSQGSGHWEYTFSSFRSNIVGFAEKSDEVIATDGSIVPATPTASAVTDAANSLGANVPPTVNLSKPNKAGNTAQANQNFKTSFLGGGANAQQATVVQGGGTPADPGTVQSFGKCEPLVKLFNEAYAKAYVTDDQSWVVRAANGNVEIQIFDKTWNSDKVRASYSKSTGVKFQDTRARRFKNF